MTMTLSECRAIREQIVNAVRPEWKKAKANKWDAEPTQVPDAPGAKLYWSARNDSKNIRQCQANLDADARERLGDAYSPNGDVLVTEETEARMLRNLEKLREAEAMLDASKAAE